MQVLVRTLFRAEWAVRIPAHNTNPMLVSPAVSHVWPPFRPTWSACQFPPLSGKSTRMSCAYGTHAVCVRDLAEFLTVPYLISPAAVQSFTAFASDTTCVMIERGLSKIKPDPCAVIGEDVESLAA
jgi:hypothetical protein